MTDHATRRDKLLTQDRRASVGYGLLSFLLLLAVAAFFGAAMGGCDPDREPSDAIVLPEKLGGAVADALGASGVRPVATTLPIEGLPPIYLQPPSRCVEEHEAVHVADRDRLGAAEWGVAYVSDIVVCVVRARPALAAVPAVFYSCYVSSRWEAAAFAAQRACELGGATP